MPIAVSNKKKVFALTGIFALLLLLVFSVGLGKYLGLISPAQTHLFTQPLDPLSETTPTGNKHITPKPWKVEEVVHGLFVPWSMAFTSPERMLVTERNGRVRVIENGKLAEKPIYTFSEVKTQQEEGLMALTLDPQYSQNHYVYFVYAYPSGNAYTDKVVRMKDNGASLSDSTTLLDGIPAAKVHAGSRIKFGPDGKLYISSGDATNKKLPQDITTLGGKILRINSDGTIPGDNPFPGSPVWSYGHRNPQGFDWNPQSQTMIETEHGPSGFDGPLGGDEVNIIEKGANYGWPVVSHNNHKDGMKDPLLVFTPAIAPASGFFYTSDLFPQWTNNFFFGMLKGEGIMRVVFDPQDPKVVLTFEKLPDVSVGRVREVLQSPDGMIYFTTSNEDGRGNATAGGDKIYRIIPSE